MPRNGDGSSDNGPIEGHEILHGTTGDNSLQHTKHVAPMPEGEKGDTLPGLSGGGTATQTSTSQSDSKKRSEPHHTSPSPTSHIQQKHSKLDTDEAGIAGATSHDSAAHAREQRVKDAVGSEDVGSGAGGHADVEMLHGEATLDGGEQEKGQGGGACDADLLQRRKAEKFGGVNLQDDEEVGGENSGASGTANGGPVGHADGSTKGKTEESFGTHDSGEMQGKSKEHGHDVGHEADLLQRKKAEKFGGVNLGDDEADASSVGKSKAHGSTNGGSSDGGAVGHASAETQSGAHNGGHVDSETHSKGSGHAAEGKKKDHGLDLANDADLLQRKKAEKFGGVNLSDD
ncbi:hypothetical protein COCVIDRAFT_107374 [Bipolaris victoriae FI3]|uniref:Uncharacterized protein n=1 Tax=Bipolaris victoriae (strain FI3) TaxID=930091 RepID=W7E770_BIPV3|nr:hypothetical protein COCVIDRAFT_107374 [Bipolaris victoriae FI3]